MGLTARLGEWGYAGLPGLLSSGRGGAGVVDLRLPLTFSEEDCALIARIIRDEVSRAWQATLAAE